MSEPMKCGHPGACLFDGTLSPESTGGGDWIKPYCTVCVEIAALQKELTDAKAIMNTLSNNQNEYAKEVLALQSRIDAGLSLARTWENEGDAGWAEELRDALSEPAAEPERKQR